MTEEQTTVPVYEKEHQPKARVELRMEKELHEKIVAITSKADISVNQLMNGLAEWACRNVVHGTPIIDYDASGRRIVFLDERKGALFFGKKSKPGDEGQVHFVLDFRTAEIVQEFE